ncbi:unnamed protein product [Sphagnum balticum]
MFTYQYAQPDEYHFSLDSIHFAEFIAKELALRPDLDTLRVLDLCAGCGVIGIELSWYVRALRHIDFVEIQESYTPHFHHNARLVNRPELDLRWHLVNYDALLETAWANQYDLIISNPPYFHPDKGILSPSAFKNRCRFFLDSTFTQFILAMTHALATKGRAYFLLRSQRQHGEDAFQKVQQLLADKPITATIVTVVRGTDVVLLEKFA